MRVLCSNEEGCMSNPLCEKTIDSRSFIETILNTPNGNRLPPVVGSERQF